MTGFVKSCMTEFMKIMNDWICESCMNGFVKIMYSWIWESSVSLDL